MCERWGAARGTNRISRWDVTLFQSSMLVKRPMKINRRFLTLPQRSGHISRESAGIEHTKL